MLSQNQKDLVIALRSVDRALADHVEARFGAGETFDQVQSSLRRAVETVDGFRIGRGC